MPALHPTPSVSFRPPGSRKSRLWFEAAVGAGLLVLTLVVTGFVGQGFGAIPLRPGHDWDWQLSIYAATARMVGDYHTLPIWNPYTAGGVPLLANPECPALHPGFWLAAPLGAERGAKLLMLVHLMLAGYGLLLLGRQIGLRTPFSLLPPLLLLGCSVLNAKLVAGHVMFQTMGYLPWVWLLLLRARGRPWLGALAGGVLGLAVLGGGHYVYVLGLFTSGLWLATLLASDPRRWWHVSLAFVAVAGLVGLSRWVPTTLAVGDAPRLLPPTAEIWPCGKDGLLGLARLWAGDFPLVCGHEGQPTFHTWFPVLLLPLGMIALVRRHWVVVGLFGLTLAISMASNLPVDLFELLHRLPVFDRLRYPERFSVVYAPLMVLMCGAGAQWLHDRVRERSPAGGTVVGALLAGLAVWHLAVALLAERSRFVPLHGDGPVDARFDGESFVMDSDAHLGFGAVMDNRGCPRCMDAIGLTAPRPWEGAFAWTDGAGQVLSATFHGTRIDVEVQADETTALQVRQAARRGWRARVDGNPVAIELEGDWLRVPLDPGYQSVILTYRAPGLWATPVCLLLAVLLIVVLARMEAQEQRW